MREDDQVVVADLPETPKPRARTDRMPDLDGLRAIAISLVLLDHFISSLPVNYVHHFAAFGWTGVDLFFVLSGFLIGGILMDHRGATNYFRTFYLRRFFRIIPLYAVLVLPMVVILLLGWQSRLSGHRLDQLNWGIVLLYLCFQQNLGNGFVFNTPGYMGPGWSLAIEEQFYLLLPPLVLFFNRQNLLKLIIAGIVTAPLIRMGLYLCLSNPARAGAGADLLLPCRWDALLSGVLVAYCVRQPSFQDWMASRLGRLRLAWVLGAAGMAFIAVSDTVLSKPISKIAGYSWIAAFFACTLLLSRQNPNGRLRCWLSRPFLKPLATISYGIYMIQGPTMALRQSVLERLHCPEFGWETFGINLITLGVTVAIAMLSWRYFENPLIRLGHQHQYVHE